MGMFRHGDRLGPYEILRPLAAGGMSVVYVAQRLPPDQGRVAVKVLRPGDDADRVFLREAWVASRVRHEHAIRVESYGEANGAKYMVMELVHGVTLAEWLSVRRRAGVPMQVDVAARLIADVCDALEAAHRLRDDAGEPLHVVHRDVSPQNVIVTFDGGVRLLDFGIASARLNGALETTRGLKGKYRYMAPEQARGEAIDARADVYAAALVLWEMLSGIRARSADDDVALREARAGQCPASLDTLRSDVPAVLDRALAEALADPPAQRTPTAAAFAWALSAAVPTCAIERAAIAELVRSDLPERAHADPRTEPFDETGRVASPVDTDAPTLAPRPRARRGLGARVGVAVGLGIVALGTLGWLAARPQPRAERAAAPRPVADAATSRSPSDSDAGDVPADAETGVVSTPHVGRARSRTPALPLHEDPAY